MMAEISNKKEKSTITFIKGKYRGTSISFGVNLVFNVIIGIFAVSCIIPFLMVLSVSFTDEAAISQYGYRLFHTDFSLAAYRYIYSASYQIYRSYMVSIFVTVVGTVYCVLLTSMYAYPLFRKTFLFNKAFSMLAFFTMIFNGGLVPTYIVMTRLLSLKDTIWALIVGGGMNVYWVFVMRAFYKTTIHESLMDSAMIDGCTEGRIYFRIVLPMSRPALATLGLFTAIGYWNNWYDALLYIRSPKLVPIQYLLMEIEQTIQYLADNAANLSVQEVEELRKNIPTHSVRNAITVSVVLPIAVTYPFFQRHFVKGLTVGSIKG
jgi:putative aldouronate transport system permease protein